MLRPISLKELLEIKEIDGIPGKFFGYILPTGYVAIKHYTTKGRYKELQEAEGFFIPVFKAKGYKDAKKRIERILKNAVQFMETNTLGISYGLSHKESRQKPASNS